MNISTTERDLEYLKVIIKEGGLEEPVGPSRVASQLEVSRAGAYKKMKTLSEREYGDYINGKGLIIKEKGIKAIKNEIKKHHIVEHFLNTDLGLNPTESCRESYKIAPFFSEKLIKKIKEKTTSKINTKCKFNQKHEIQTKNLPKCHWINEKTIKNQKKG